MSQTKASSMETSGQILTSNRRGLTPDASPLLAAWQYMEYSILRIIAGWGRSAGDWEDKLAVCYHVWLQAEIVDRLRKRLEMFPPHKPELPVSGKYESFCNDVLLAPSWTSAMEAVHTLLNPTLTEAYSAYQESSHPVHDRPTHEMLREIIEIKRIQAKWFADFKRREIDVKLTTPAEESYLHAIQTQLPAMHCFATPLPAIAPAAAPCGKNVDFRMPAAPGHVKDWNAAPNIFPLLEMNWSESVETRRLFFMIGYFWEMGVAEGQLRWIYSAHFMPWEFIYAEARHMWDESRHGNSGLARLRDFGLDIKDVGYNSYGAAYDEGEIPGAMTREQLVESFFKITHVAEMGYFKTKRYCFEDFAAGGDPASAEMMQFDIIDETSHVEYGRTWLAALAEHAGIEDDWDERGAQDREIAQAASDARVAAYKRYTATRDPKASLVLENVAPDVAPTGSHKVLLDPAACVHYEWLLSVLREKCPLTNAATAPIRPNLPM